MAMAEEKLSGSGQYRGIGLVLGLAAFATVLLMPAPEGMKPEAQRVGAIALLMGIWWVTETLPIVATALLPLVLFPTMDILPAGETSACYGDSTIFLFAGGFFIAMAMQQ